MGSPWALTSLQLAPHHLGERGFAFKHAERVNGAWQTTELEASAPANPVGDTCAITRHNGEIWILYQAEDTLKLARRPQDGGPWRTEVVSVGEIDAGAGHDVQVARRADGSLALVHASPNNRWLYVSYEVNGVWETDLIFLAAHAATRPTAAFDGDGVLHIAHGLLSDLDRDSDEGLVLTGGSSPSPSACTAALGFHPSDPLAPPWRSSVFRLDVAGLASPLACSQAPPYGPKDLGLDPGLRSLERTHRRRLD